MIFRVSKIVAVPDPESREKERELVHRLYTALKNGYHIEVLSEGDAKIGKRVWKEVDKEMQK